MPATIAGGLTIPAASRCGWPAAEFKGRVVYGEQDDFGYNIVKDPVSSAISMPRSATVFNQLGIDHQHLRVKYYVPDMRLTGIEKAHMFQSILT